MWLVLGMPAFRLQIYPVTLVCPWYGLLFQSKSTDVNFDGASDEKGWAQSRCKINRNARKYEQ